MSTLREPTFWYGLITGILLTITILILAVAYIHRRLTHGDEGSDQP